ncbi:hypothetical protein THAOC_34220 [Thalassiosira oceanica]|uniref:Uncharacterized protein n=1 Tax=Thalassiosira oceanica TaxID=159749 RepID=K0RK63_THAOC|nr:hypothetical protein THAOC_34220 [Thalassiosira oceanica]|eukprot:EJK47087.1 hypothetical protein THAOC_34220 [Thalassiosira oceanica]
MSASATKRRPFQTSSVVHSNSNTMNQPVRPRKNMEPPSCVMSTRRGAPMSISVKRGGARSSPRSRASSPSVLPATAGSRRYSADDRSRQYKSEAYEAKIRIASQEQMISSLRKELDEIRCFRQIEEEQVCADATKQEFHTKELDQLLEKSKRDAELIEALAQELETMEQDLRSSRSRVTELERYQISKDASVARLTKELKKARNDTSEGLSIMRDLDTALRAARAERDEARDALKQAKPDLQSELEMKSIREERDRIEQSRHRIYKENTVLTSKVEELQKKTTTLQRALDERADQFEQQSLDLELKTGALNELESLHTTTCKNMETEHSAELSKHVMKHDALVEQHKKDLNLKDQLLKSRECHWGGIVNELDVQLDEARTKIKEFDRIENDYISQIKGLTESLSRLESPTSSVDELPIDELNSNLASLQSENELLARQRDDLQHKLEIGLSIYQKAKDELQATRDELLSLQSERNEDGEFLTGREQIESLKADVAMYETQLDKANARARRLESSHCGPNDRATSDTADRIVAMEREIAELTERASKVAEMEARNDELQDACTELELALSALYAKSRPASPDKTPNERSEESRKIENDALLDYVATRMKRGC